MTTDFEALATRVEADDKCPFFLGKAWEALGEPDSDDFDFAIDGSLDAALALHEAVLPSHFKPNLTLTNEHGWYVTIWRGEYRNNIYHTVGHSLNTNPAAAWVAAILRAVGAKENEDA
ncbi:hypothetical protein OAF54_00710 [bacterium]|nr:hypothetical protein [bacterium]